MASCSTSANFEEEVFTLNGENELRFIVDGSSKVSLEVNSGLAEVFGTELMYGKKYVFPANARVAVFTWQGCTLTLSGKVESLYVAKETPMVIYVNVHAAIEQLRQIADAKGTKGPVVMITGPKDVGKSCLCRILLNYAFRQGRTPVFVDLDVGQSDISVPGTLGALLVDEPADPVDGFAQKKPLVFHYGHKSPGHNITLYNLIVSRIAHVVNSRNRNNTGTSHSGIIINTCGWVKSDGYRALTNAAMAFEVSVVLVLGHERVYHEFTRDLPPFVKVVYLPRSGGAIDRDHVHRSEARENVVREYFYGISKPLRPHSFTVHFSDIKLYRIQHQQQLAEKPVSGTENKEAGLCLVPVQPGFHLLNRVLSVTFCMNIKEDILNTHLAGFICITKVDSARRELTVLSPQAPPLPPNILLYSDVMFSQELHSSHNL